MYFQGYTALHLAVIQGHENVIATLLDCGTLNFTFLALSHLALQTRMRRY